MKNKKRGYVWISLLLMCGLFVSGMDVVWANEEPKGQEGDIPNSMVSDDGWRLSQEEKRIVSSGMVSSENNPEEKDGDIIDVGIENSDIDYSVEEGLANDVQDEWWMGREGNKIISSDMILSENRDGDIAIEEKSISQNDKETSSEEDLEKRVDLSKNAISQDCAVISENESNDEAHKKAFNVLLPTEVPFGIVLLGKEGHRGVIRSEQFCIENKGFEDVCVSIEGVCVGEDGEEFVVSDVSVKNEIVEKKNVWMYLKWEDENGGELGKKGITMGEASKPGEGVVVLKAPIRDKKGKIIEDSPESKVYFSFVGDINAGTSGDWKGEGLKVNLDFAIEELISKNNVDDEKDVGISSSDLRSSDRSVKDMGSISDNIEILDGSEGVINGSDDLKNVSENLDVFTIEKKSISEDEVRQSLNMSANDGSISDDRK